MNWALIAGVVGLMIAARRWVWIFWAYMALRVLPWAIGYLFGYEVLPPDELAIEAAITLTIPYFVGRLIFGGPSHAERS